MPRRTLTVTPGNRPLVHTTFSNGGIRVFDTTNPFQSQEVAYYIPRIPESADANGIRHAVADLLGGLYTLEMNG